MIGSQPLGRVMITMLINYHIEFFLWPDYSKYSIENSHWILRMDDFQRNLLPGKASFKPLKNSYPFSSGQEFGGSFL